MKGLLKLVTGALQVFLATLCFLAFHRYTYFFLIEAPPYDWLIWCIRHSAMIYWLAIAGSALAFRSKWGTIHFGITVGLQALAATVFTVSGGIAILHNDWRAYAWSLVIAGLMLLQYVPELPGWSDSRKNSENANFISYGGGLLAAVAIAVFSDLSARINPTEFFARHPLGIKDVELLLFVMAAHAWLAILIVTVFNSVQWVGKNWFGSGSFRTWAMLLLMVAGIQMALVRFLRGALSFDGTAIRVFAVVLAMQVTILCYSAMAPALRKLERLEWTGPSRGKLILLTLFGFLCLGAAQVYLPGLIRPTDWNGFFEAGFALACWFLIATLSYVVVPRADHYSLPAIVAVLIVSGAIYAGMTESAFLWAKPLGVTDHDVERSLVEHETQNRSFLLTRSIFSSNLEEACDEDCHFLRQYTNIHNARAEQKLELVEKLARSADPHPNIFIIVVDSLRADYLGIYNPKADFTPNIDALGRDSVAFRNAYTQYAGTSLSVPAIWSGALLLHAHYMRPFENVNSLRTLAITDGYQVVVSYDHILKKLISPDDDIVKLDEDKKFNELEISSTFQELESYLDRRADKSRPVLFYTQPMNIHILGENPLPKRTATNWRERQGFNDRIAFKLHQVDDAVGDFVRYLKSRGLYDNSIVIVTSDHGEATGELPGFGLVRQGHSDIMFPEIMRVPLIVHVPVEMRKRFVSDEGRLVSLTDITPTLYYLLGHRPLKSNPLFGQPFFAQSEAELQGHQRDHLFLASDARATYGFLTGDLGQMYVYYDTPARSMLFDLKRDPEGLQNIEVTREQRSRYNEEVVRDIRSIADFYHYRPSGGSTADFSWDGR